MTNQAPERATPKRVDPEERRIQAFVTSFGEIRTMDLEPDTLRALLDDDPLETERTEERAAADRPD
jgi:hypothetical protein